jgi:hypothetical protein
MNNGSLTVKTSERVRRKLLLECEGIGGRVADEME